ncbi:hypothetical protein CHUAL_013422 [Chamberlinius hualienensis]
MLEALKQKLFANPPESPERLPDDLGRLDLSAGATLLENYKLKWEELHTSNEEVAKVAEKVEKLHQNATKNVTDNSRVINELLSHLNSLPQLVQDIQNATKTIELLGDCVMEVESCLLDLENVVELEELQSKKTNESYKLAVHKEKRQIDHNHLKDALESRYLLKVEEKEKERSRQLSERQNTFSEAFQQDVQQYLQFGKIQRLEGVRGADSNIRLEDVNIEEEDNDDLGAFLAN